MSFENSLKKGHLPIIVPSTKMASVTNFPSITKREKSQVRRNIISYNKLPTIQMANRWVYLFFYHLLLIVTTNYLYVSFKLKHFCQIFEHLRFFDKTFESEKFLRHKSCHPEINFKETLVYFFMKADLTDSLYIRCL